MPTTGAEVPTTRQVGNSSVSGYLVSRSGRGGPPDVAKGIRQRSLRVTGPRRES